MFIAFSSAEKRVFHPFIRRCILQKVVCDANLIWIGDCSTNADHILDSINVCFLFNDTVLLIRKLCTLQENGEQFLHFSGAWTAAREIRMMASVWAERRHYFFWSRMVRQTSGIGRFPGNGSTLSTEYLLKNHDSTVFSSARANFWPDDYCSRLLVYEKSKTALHLPMQLRGPALNGTYAYGCLAASCKML